MSLFNKSKTVDGRTPEALFLQRIDQAVANVRETIRASGARVNKTTRGVCVIPEETPATGSFTPLKPYVLTNVRDDYLIAREFLGYDPDNGTVMSGDTDVFIAKEFKTRTSIEAETVLGEDHVYTYSDGPEEAWAAGTDTAYNLRRADSNGSETQQQRILPPWTDGEIFFAVPANTRLKTTADDGEKPIKLLIVGRSAQWAGPTS